MRPALLSLTTLATAVALACTAGERSGSDSADLIVTGARIYTANDSQRVADAMAIRGDRIVFVGPAPQALELRGDSTRVVDYGGRTIIPGMIDAHAHLANLGTALRTVNLVGTTSYDDVIARVAARAREVPAGTWITGRGWDQNDWSDQRFPTHDALSRAVPDHPVYLTRIDGHASLVNARAMREAALTASVRDPEGGRVERGRNGAPAGVLVDRAMQLVSQKIPPPSTDQLRDLVLAAVREANRWGLTGIHDAGVPRRVIDVYEELAKDGRYSLRNYVMIASDDSTLAHYFQRGPRSGLYDGHLWLRSIKISADGALGSRGAALLQPYSDDPGNTGLITTPAERVRGVAVRALRGGFQLNVHAIGDRANRMVLDAFQVALDSVPTPDHRFRVEHAQILDPADIPRFAAMRVIPSMQGSHQTSDMYWAGDRLGTDRLRGAYAWRSLLESGVVIPNGSDFPVEEVNPLISFHSAVSRQDARNWPANGWYPEQRMTREEALKSMTAWPAHAAFQDSLLGTLSPGKYADFVVLDQDIMTVPAESILATRVVATYLGGRPVYEAATVEARADTTAR